MRNEVRHAVSSAVAVRANLLRVAHGRTTVRTADESIFHVQTVDGCVIVVTAEILAEILCSDAQDPSPVYIYIRTGKDKINPVEIREQNAR
jgi:hypothetical protein